MWYSKKSSLTRPEIIALLLTLAFIAIGMFAPAINQSSAYHQFADTRMLLGIPRALDVMSNAAFFVAAVYGLRIMSSCRRQHTKVFVWSVYVFFIGVMLTAFGSGYYHLVPDSERLVWDRLPMTLAFAGVCGALAVSKVSIRAGWLTLAACLLAGLFSIITWDATGNLTPYVTLQFGGLLAVTIGHFFGKPSAEDLPWGALLVCYGLAKVAEHYDHQIFELLGNAISGHSLKHILASGAAFAFANYISRKSSPPRGHQLTK